MKSNIYEKNEFYSPIPFFNQELDFSQDNLGPEENREDEQNGSFSLKTPNFDETKLYFQNEIDFYADRFSEEDNNLDEKNLAKTECLLKPISQINLGLINPNTKYTTNILSQKTKGNDEELVEKKEDILNKKSKKNIKNNQNLNFIENNKITKNGKEKKKGRKKKEEKEKGDHTKDSYDNIMRKIKTHFLNQLNKFLNRIVINKKLIFKRMSTDLNKELKRDYNLDLLDKTLKYLYENEPLSGKFRSKKFSNKEHNKKLIKKIYEENTEIEAINLLNLTYRELFSVFTRNIKPISSELEMKIQNISCLQYDNDFTNINAFFKELEDKCFKEEEFDDNVNNYLKKVKNLCIDYEKWFLDKKGRKRTSKK